MIHLTIAEIFSDYTYTNAVLDAGPAYWFIILFAIASLSVFCIRRIFFITRRENPLQSTDAILLLAPLCLVAFAILSAIGDLIIGVHAVGIDSDYARYIPHGIIQAFSLLAGLYVMAATLICVIAACLGYLYSPHGSTDKHSHFE